jgi:predicted nuclease of predicted toxin-antitoxin system
MKFKIDENLPSEFADVLRSANHDAVTVLEQKLGGSIDEDIFAACRREDRTLLSLDLDFSDIRLYPPANSPGTIVFRIQPQDKNYLLDCLQRIIPLLKEGDFTDRLWIVEKGRIRIRE